MNAVPLASESSFVQAHVAAADVPRVQELVNRAKRGQEALRHLARDFVIQAAANGALYEELRALFPPRSGWQVWVSAEVGVSVKTITRQRRLAQFVADNPGALDRLHPDVGVTAAYLLAARDTPRQAVLELLPKLEQQPMGEARVRQSIEGVRQEQRLAALDGRVYDLYQNGEVSLKNGLEMAQNVGQWPESVQQVIYGWRVENVELYPLLARLAHYLPDEFASLARSGHVWSDALARQIELRDASPTDLELLLRQHEAQSFLMYLDNVRSSEQHQQHKAQARHVGNFSGRLDEIVPELRRLETDKRYYIVIYEALVSG